MPVAIGDVEDVWSRGRLRRTVRDLKRL